MITVPDTFAPSVTQGENPMVPAAAPSVRPMQNAAPSLLLQTGQTLMQAGELGMKLGNTIGDRIDETVDDAQTKAAENQFLQSSIPLLSQYHTTEGINATQQFEPTAQAILKSRDDVRATLANPVQQRMFDLATNGQILTFQQQMAVHKDEQAVQYGKSEADKRADNQYSMAQLAHLRGDMAGYAKYRATGDAEVAILASLSGFAPDSDAAQAMLKAKRGEMVHGIVVGLHDRNAIDEEEQFFNEEFPNLDMRTREVLGNLVHGDVKQRAGMTAGQESIKFVKGVSGGPGNLQPPIPAGTITTMDGVDGIDIHTPPGSSLHAPESGTVTKVWIDDEMGLSAQVTLPNSYTATFNGLTAVNYKEGQKITQGQVLGLTGKNDNGQGVVHYALTDPDGKFIDPRRAASAPWDPKNFNSPEDLEKSIEYINSHVSDEEEQRAAERYVTGVYNRNREALSQLHAGALKQATDYWFQNGRSLSKLPGNIRMQLTPEDMEGFERRGLERYNLTQAEKSIRDTALQANWIEHPEEQTVDAVRQAYAQGHLSDSAYQTALRQAMALKGQDTNSTDPQKVRTATVDHDQLTDILALNQLPHLAQPETAGNQSAKAAAQLQRVELETVIKTEIDRQQTIQKRELNWQEKQKIMRDLIVDKVYASGNSANDLKPTSILTSDEMSKAHVWVGGEKVRMMDIPPQYTMQAMQDLQANGYPTTQANIAAWWVRKGKPTQ